MHICCFANETKLLLKKVCYKVSFCENFKHYSCRKISCLSNDAQMLVEDVPFNQKF